MPDPALLARVRKLIEPGDRCIDVGSGTAPQNLARYRHHICIEPNPLCVHWLERRAYCVKSGRALDVLPDMAPAFAVYLLDVLHTMVPEDAKHVLALAKSKAVFQLIVSSPPLLASSDQPKNMWDRYRSVWTTDMLGPEPWQHFSSGETAFMSVLTRMPK